ncbi:hypothetical protein D0Z07_1766 [Hyphodiscus hymeniophilus]|uniref:Uncharacterized protein n=1 Tax=Hyphodiscus hymeniophilus TaxID=353542 RepID=A0A9P7AZX7_9HELO|nr:hypothetical protein D0Z07_1766 [Hyphodiscus hymeniophilus]
MSFLLRTSRLVAARPVVAARAFQTSSVRALKEGDHSSPDQAEHNEKHKQDQLKKQKEGKGHWKPELASNSEESVAADRNHDGESIENLQKRTTEHAEKKHQHGTSQDTGL